MFSISEHYKLGHSAYATLGGHGLVAFPLGPPSIVREFSLRSYSVDISVVDIETGTKSLFSIAHCKCACTIKL